MRLGRDIIKGLAKGQPTFPRSLTELMNGKIKSEAMATPAPSLDKNQELRSEADRIFG